MKNCPNCKSEVEDNFDLCWNCNYSFPDNKILDFEDADIERSNKKMIAYVVRFRLYILGILSSMKEQDLEFSEMFLKHSQTENHLTYLYVLNVEK